tara:strand:+ start:225 stop:476 length:252 start_codon:yes stop_codon:yes gene_type:complete
LRFGSFFNFFSFFCFGEFLAVKAKGVIRVDRKSVAAVTGITRSVTKKAGFTHHLPLPEFLELNNQFLIESKFLSLGRWLNTQE